MEESQLSSQTNEEEFSASGHLLEDKHQVDTWTGHRVRTTESAQMSHIACSNGVMTNSSFPETKARALMMARGVVNMNK